MVRFLYNIATQSGHQRAVVAEPLQEKNTTAASPASKQVQVTIDIEETALP